MFNRIFSDTEHYLEQLTFMYFVINNLRHFFSLKFLIFLNIFSNLLELRCGSLYIFSARDFMNILD